MATDLGDFEGRIITHTAIAVTNAGDGLSKALKVDPVVLHQGDTVYVVMECEVGKIGFDPYAEGVCARVQTLKAGTATIMDAPVVKEAIAAQAERIQRAKDAAAGQSTLTDGLLVLDHREGKHADGRVEFCDLCNEEVAAEAAEAK